MKSIREACSSICSPFSSSLSPSPDLLCCSNLPLLLLLSVLPRVLQPLLIGRGYESRRGSTWA